MTDVMTPLERVYSLEASVRLNFATMMEIYKSGGLLQNCPGHLSHLHVLGLMHPCVQPCALPQICWLLLCAWALRIPRAGVAGANMQGNGGNAERLEVLYAGYTRIPVYEKDPQDIIGILYTKDLILVDPGNSQASLSAWLKSVS